MSQLHMKKDIHLVTDKGHYHTAEENYFFISLHVSKSPYYFFSNLDSNYSDLKFLQKVRRILGTKDDFSI